MTLKRIIKIKAGGAIIACLGFFAYAALNENPLAAIGFIIAFFGWACAYAGIDNMPNSQ